jgi:hypothetical protein
MVGPAGLGDNRGNSTWAFRRRSARRSVDALFRRFAMEVLVVSVRFVAGGWGWLTTATIAVRGLSVCAVLDIQDDALEPVAFECWLQARRDDGTQPTWKNRRG